MNKENIFLNIPELIPDEVFEKILETKMLKIERIISKGHASPDGFFYDQRHHEWVILLKGKAGLLFENENKIIEIKQGDYINIPAHVKHRVAWTDPDQETIWLAIHYCS